MFKLTTDQSIIIPPDMRYAHSCCYCEQPRKYILRNVMIPASVKAVMNDECPRYQEALSAGSLIFHLSHSLCERHRLGTEPALKVSHDYNI